MGKNAGTIEDIQSKFRGAKLIFKLCLALARAGVSYEYLAEFAGQQSQEIDKGTVSMEEASASRKKASEFMGRIIASAFDAKTYAYLRQDIDWSSHVNLSAVDIMNFPKDDKRLSNPLVVISNAGLQMTPKMAKQSNRRKASDGKGPSKHLGKTKKNTKNEQNKQAVNKTERNAKSKRKKT